jgi:hypothetical protein
VARIEWVKARLDNWARWVTQRDSGGTGYPKQSAFARAAGSATSTDTAVIPIDDIDASRTHDVVERLHWERQELWLTLQCHYIGSPWAKANRRRPMSTDEAAGLMSITRRTVQARLELADAVLAGMLQQRERS